MRTFLVPNAEAGWQAVKDLTAREVRITFLGDPWDQDVMTWSAGVRHDMLRLAWQKRKLDLAKSLGWSCAAAYRLPVGTNALVERFGQPLGIRVELLP